MLTGASWTPWLRASPAKESSQNKPAAGLGDHCISNSTRVTELRMTRDAGGERQIFNLNIIVIDYSSNMQGYTADVCVVHQYKVNCTLIKLSTLTFCPWRAKRSSLSVVKNKLDSSPFWWSVLRPTVLLLRRSIPWSREDPGNECEITFNRLAIERLCGMKGRDKWLRNLQTTKRWRNENGSRVFRHASQPEEHFFQHSLRYSVLGEEKNFFNREKRDVPI